MISVCGRAKTTEDLRSISVVKPEKAGNRWQGISHHELASTIEDSLGNRGISIKSEKWATDNTGQSLAGGINVKFPFHMDIPDIPGMDYSLGIRHYAEFRLMPSCAVPT